jgi:hypothetical protein
MPSGSLSSAGGVPENALYDTANLMALFTGLGRPRERSEHLPALTELGWNRLTGVLLASQVLILLAFGLLGWWLGLRLDWESLPAALPLLMLALAGWGYYLRFPGRQRSDWLVAETMAIVALLCSSGLVAGPAQYVAAALNRPVIDPWLAAADRMLGIDVPSLVAWTARRPRLVYVLWLAYNSFQAQLLAAPLVVGVVLRDREALWEYAFHLHFTTLVTIVAFALWPAACVFTTLGFSSLLDQARFIDHFNRSRAGLLIVISYNDIEGLVSCPSFHVAMAMVVTWIVRRYRLLFALMIVIDAALSAATVFLGAHYAIDVAASGLTVMASVWLYSHWGLRLRRQALPLPPLLAARHHTSQ